MNVRFQNFSMYNKRLCNCTQRSPCHFDLSVHFMMFRCRQPQTNSASLAFFFEIRQGKLGSCIWWNSFEIPPSKLVYFSKSGLEHIQLILNFFCCDFQHTIKFWMFRVGINNQKIIRKSCVTCQKFGCCWCTYIHKNSLEGCLWLVCIIWYSEWQFPNETDKACKCWNILM